MQLALLSAVTYWIANRVASRLQALVGKVCYYVCVSAWRCGHLRAMDFVCGAFVCAVVCASPTPRRRATRIAYRFKAPAKAPATTRLLLGPQASPARTLACIQIRYMYVYYYEYYT